MPHYQTYQSLNNMTNEEFQKPSHSKLERSIRKHNKKVTRLDLKDMSRENVLTKAKSSFHRMNAERKRQGYKPKTDRASKGLYDFLDKYQ